MTRDLEEKPALYARLGVDEYFLFDPLADCLSPQLRAFQLSPAGIVEMEGPEFTSVPLDCIVSMEDGQLKLIDRASRNAWQTEAEIERQAREREQAARNLLEIENARLREEIARLRGQL